MTTLSGWAVLMRNEQGQAYTFILLGDFPSFEQIRKAVTLLKLDGAWKLESVQQSVPVMDPVS